MNLPTVPPVPIDLAGLARAAPASASEFLAEGGELWIAGAGMRPEFRIGRGRRRLATVRVAGLGPAANLLAFPGVVRRDFAAASVVETLVVATELPLAVAQWRGLAAGSTVEIELEHGGAAMVGDDDVITLPMDGRVLALKLVPAGPSPDVRSTPGGVRVAVHPRPDGSGHVSLVLAIAEKGRVPAALAPVRHLDAHAKRAAEGPIEGLFLETGVRELDEGVRWLRARLAAQLAAAAADGRTPVLPALAAIEGGDRTGPRRLLEAASAPSGDCASIAAAMVETFGLTRYASDVADRWLAEGANYDDPAMAAGARRLALALERVASPPVVEGLRRLAAAAPKVERRLPTVGPGGPAPGPRPDREPLGRAAYRADPDRAWHAWRQAIDGPPVGPVLWDPAPDGNSDRSRTAELLRSLTRGLLGLEADAPSGRLVLAPRLPSHLTGFEARGLTIGDCSVRFRYDRREGRSSFQVVPEWAPVPPIVIFEPRVVGAVSRVRIDGEEVELDVSIEGTRSVVPVQIPIDGPRRVDVDAEEPSFDGPSDRGS